jgi:hypothetical protein
MTFVSMATVHIGKKIKEVLKQSRMGATEFGAAINKSRTVVYDIFERDTIDTGLLQKISTVLDHNFFNYYGHDLPQVKDDSASYGKKQDITSLGEELKAVRRQLEEMEKRYELLEKVNRLTEEKLESLKKGSGKKSK